jgi:hypothetical protein
LEAVAGAAGLRAGGAAGRRAAVGLDWGGFDGTAAAGGVRGLVAASGGACGVFGVGAADGTDGAACSGGMRAVSSSSGGGSDIDGACAMAAGVSAVSGRAG